MELTKTPPIDDAAVTLRFTCPASKKEAAVRTLESFGCSFVTEEEPVVPWRDAFPEKRSDLPGMVLAGQRMKHGMTQRALAEATHTPQRHISEMENGKRPIGKENAKRLAAALHVDYRVFL